MGSGRGLLPLRGHLMEPLTASPMAPSAPHSLRPAACAPKGHARPKMAIFLKEAASGAQ